MVWVAQPETTVPDALTLTDDPALDLALDDFTLNEADVSDARGDTIWGDIGGLDWLRSRNERFVFTGPIDVPVDQVLAYTPEDADWIASLAATEPSDLPPILVEYQPSLGPTAIGEAQDGRHRLQAAKDRGDTTIAAYLFIRTSPEHTDG